MICILEARVDLISVIRDSLSAISLTIELDSVCQEIRKI